LGRVPVFAADGRGAAVRPAPVLRDRYSPFSGQPPRSGERCFTATSRRWQASGPGVSTTAAVTQRSIRRDLRPIGGVALTVTKPSTVDAINVHAFFT